jgi:hypothetical protein
MNRRELLKGMVTLPLFIFNTKDNKKLRFVYEHVEGESLWVKKDFKDLTKFKLFILCEPEGTFVNQIIIPKNYFEGELGLKYNGKPGVQPFISTSDYYIKDGVGTINCEPVRFIPISELKEALLLRKQ